jgi:hypothetical protein
MKISFLSIGIEVVEAVVDVFSSEASRDPSQPEVAGIHSFRSSPQRYRAEVSVIFEVPDDPERLLNDASHRVQGRGGATQTGQALSPLLAETGRLGLKAVLARSALLALPALAVLVAPRVARAALPAAGRNTLLRSWVRGLLPAQPPRLPATPFRRQANSG